MQFRLVFQVLGSPLRHRPRPFRKDQQGGRVKRMKAALVGAIAVFAGAASPAAADEVVITVTNLRSSEGVVRACMTTNQAIFPRCIKDPDAHRTVVPAGKTVTIRFSGVKPGDYAIALLHDENNNGKADRTLGMIPKEGYGFSRDAKVSFGPPKFGDAVFTHGSGRRALKITMRYF